jgi:LPXTG-motif cell wall-anchored protein
LYTNIRGADGSVGRFSLLVRICVALAVALLSVPLLMASPTFAEDGDGTSTEAPAPAEEAPAPAEEAPEEPAAKEPAAELPDAKTPRTKTRTAATIQAAPTANTGCKVDRHDQNTQEDRAGDWQNGNLNENNSAYAEGDYVPHRLVLSGLTAGTHTIVVSYDRTVGGKYAYDFLDHLGIEGSAGASISWDAETPAPPMPFATNVEVTITFTIVDAGDDTANIIFDGHIAAGLHYFPALGAGGISGSPYHVDVQSISCGNVGNMDRSLKASAVAFGFVTIVKNAQPNSAEDFEFDVQAPNDIQESIFLDDDADPTLPDTATFTVPPGDTTITELLGADSDWTLTDITCSEAGQEAGTGVTVNVSDREAVTCTFTNSRESSLVVDKYWVINGGTPVQEGSEPAHLGLGAQLTVNGDPEALSTILDGYLEGAGVTLDESVTFGNNLCYWADATQGEVTEAKGQTPADGSLPFSDTLGGGSNHYTITNTVTCDSNLTLAKDVLNGPALASAWTLSATPVDGSDLPFSSGSTGVSHPVTADSDYQLDEDDADSRYNQVGAWKCTQFGTVTTVSGEQRVSVEAGRSATCTVVNATAELILRKVVQNPNGGTAVPGDFTLIASPQGGGADLTTPGSDQGTSFFVDPDEVFDLSESGGPDGYTLTGINCGNGPVTSVQVPVSTTVTCTFTNVDSPGSLTLDKIVDDNGTGDTTPETAWHLSGTPQGIANQPTIEGDGGATGATKAGTYVLDESGPDTHTEGTWTCEDDGGDPVAVNGSNEITLAASQNVTCEITNTAITPQLTLIKHVDPILPPPLPPPPTNPPLPNTGAQAYLTQLALLGGLVLVLGVALLGRSRRKDEA